MGNSAQGTGYGCELPAMVELWRSVWRAQPDAVFGVATLAAGGSEGNGQHMAGMRWSETSNFGTLPSPAMPNSFVAQVYDLGDPWAAKEKGWSGGDPMNCSLPDPATEKYGVNCTRWNSSNWSAGMQPYADLIRTNSPSGNPGVNFMGGIHPRLKRPVGHRLAVAAASLMHEKTPLTGPTIAGCQLSGSTIADRQLTLKFNLTLLGDDTVQVQNFVNADGSDANNMSTWAGTGAINAVSL
jgi:hypothetical protein